MGLAVASRRALQVPHEITGIVAVLAFVSIHHLLARADLRDFRQKGRLMDYLNSGLSPKDVFLGIIYPLVIAEWIGLMVVLTYALLTAKLGGCLQIQFALWLISMGKSLSAPPSISIHQLDSYLDSTTRWSHLMGGSIVLRGGSFLFLFYLQSFLFARILVAANYGGAWIVPLAIAILGGAFLSSIYLSSMAEKHHVRAEADLLRTYPSADLLVEKYLVPEQER